MGGQTCQLGWGSLVQISIFLTCKPLIPVTLFSRLSPVMLLIEWFDWSCNFWNSVRGHDRNFCAVYNQEWILFISIY